MPGGLGGPDGASVAPGPAEDCPGGSDGSGGSIVSPIPGGAPLTVTQVVTPTIEPTSHNPIFSMEFSQLQCKIKTPGLGPLVSCRFFLTFLKRVLAKDKK